MDQHSITQTKIEAGGDVAGLNIDKSLVINNARPSTSPLAELITKYKQELANGESFDAIIEKLQHWSAPDPTSEVLGVKEKLEKGQRPDLIPFGLRAKELFAKCLARHQNSKAAQEMCAILLAAVWQRFGSVIYPRILEGVPNVQIDLLLQSEIMRPVEEMLDANPLQIDQAEIAGMIYFLTGNCHLNWH